MTLREKVNQADREIRRGEWTLFLERDSESLRLELSGWKWGLNVIRLLSEFDQDPILVNDLKDKTKELEHILKPKILNTGL